MFARPTGLLRNAINQPIQRHSAHVGAFPQQHLCRLQKRQYRPSGHPVSVLIKFIPVSWRCKRSTVVFIVGFFVNSAVTLERSYLNYSHRQRQKSLIIVNVVDLVLKFVLAAVYLLQQQHYVITLNFILKDDVLTANLNRQEIPVNAIVWSVCCVFANIGICVLGVWRCFANNYLHWAATCTWLLLNLQGSFGKAL